MGQRAGGAPARAGCGAAREESGELTLRVRARVLACALVTLVGWLGGSGALTWSRRADVGKSKVSADALAAFLASEVQEDVTSVPGIGPAAAKKLAEAVEGDQAITTTYQLIGKFLTLKGKGVSQAEHCDAMWFWLQARGLDSHRAGIVHSIAEKVSRLRFTLLAFCSELWLVLWLELWLVWWLTHAVRARRSTS